MHKIRQINSLVSFYALTLLLASCSAAPAETQSPNTPTEENVLSIPSTAERTIPAETTPSLPPPPVPTELVWFGPNMGSVDYVELFTNPEVWSDARRQIDVFRFHSSVLFPVACPICGDNSLRKFASADAFRLLDDWGIAIAIEVGAIYEDGCDGAKTFIRDAGVVVRNVQENGGVVSFIAMDEPLLHSGIKLVQGACNYTTAEAAAQTAAFVDEVNKQYPNIIVGDTEPYPHYSVSELKDWIQTLEANGVHLPFFHLDVDIERVRVEGQNVAADLQELRRFCEGRGIIFGVIFTSNWTQSNSNRAYYVSTMDWLNIVKAAIGRPNHAIFESWQGPAPSGDHEFPVNLSANDPEGYSHTKLIVDGLNTLGE